jgi:RNA-directed DNA polymerase
VNVRPARQLWLPLCVKSDTFALGPVTEHPVGDEQLMERVLERENLVPALKRVEQNKGSAGVDGMTVEELRPFLKASWPGIRQDLLTGRYRPQPVRRAKIPKPAGGVRKLGIPTALDRFIQQALLQVLQPRWDGTFSEGSFGFRPKRSAHQAVKRAQSHLRAGYSWVVDIDLEKFFDRVNHDKLMGEVCKRIRDWRVIALIRRYLEAGAFEDDTLHETTEGTPQGGPLSPLLANLLLDELDRELEKRGHRFVRYADDCNIYVGSRRAGERVLKSITGLLAKRLKLKVNEAKSTVGRPWDRSFLGFSFSWKTNRRVSIKALKAMKQRVREITFRTRGRRIEQVVQELRKYLLGWKAYFGISEVRYVFKELDSWIKRRLRCYLWKQWGRGGYRELRKRGVSRDLAWNTAKSAHSPWRLSRSPALAFALPARYFASLGLPQLFSKLT